MDSGSCCRVTYLEVPCVGQEWIRYRTEINPIVITCLIGHSLAPLNWCIGDSFYNSDTVIFPACHWLDQNHLISPFRHLGPVTCDAPGLRAVAFRQWQFVSCRAAVLSFSQGGAAFCLAMRLPPLFRRLSRPVHRSFRPYPVLFNSCP